jgi:hypothetical protein
MVGPSPGHKIISNNNTKYHTCKENTAIQSKSDIWTNLVIELAI